MKAMTVEQAMSYFTRVCFFQALLISSSTQIHAAHYKDVKNAEKVLTFLFSFLSLFLTDITGWN